MKKSLLALAVLGAFAVSAQAQSTNVTIGGVIQANIKNYKVSNSAAGVSTSNETRVDDDYTSRFWLTGTEDLGGGNSALFYVENRFNTDVGSPQGAANGLGNGDTFLGLKGAWGQATLGKHTMMYTQGVVTEVLASGGTVSAIPTGMLGTFSILSSVAGVGLTTTRVNNSFMYKTPNFSGFSGSIGIGASGSNSIEGQIPGRTQVGNAQVPGGGALTTGGAPAAAGGAAGDYSKGQQVFLQAGYANGPFYANVAYWDTQVEGRPTTILATTADQKEFRLSGSYVFPFGLKIGAQYDRAELQDVGRVLGVGGTDLKRNAWQIPVSYTFGASTILGSFTKAGNTSGLAGNTGAKMYTLGYDYALSKRTNVGVYYSQLKNDSITGAATGGGTYSPFLAGTSASGSPLAAGEKASTFALGIKHTF